MGRRGLQAAVLAFHSFCTGKLLLNYILVFACAKYFLYVLVKALNPNLPHLITIFFLLLSVQLAQKHPAQSPKLAVSVLCDIKNRKTFSFFFFFLL